MARFFFSFPAMSTIVLYCFHQKVKYSYFSSDADPPSSSSLMHWIISNLTLGWALGIANPCVKPMFRVRTLHVRVARGAAPQS